jgi:hypothetical protein
MRRYPAVGWIMWVTGISSPLKPGSDLLEVDTLSDSDYCVYYRDSVTHPDMKYSHPVTSRDDVYLKNTGVYV